MAVRLRRSVGRDFALALGCAGVSVLTVTVLFVWPGFLAITHCEPSQGSHETVNGTTYCTLAVPYPSGYDPSTHHNYCPNATLPPGGPNGTPSPILCGPPQIVSAWGFTFRASQWLNPGVLTGGFIMNLTEPNGTTFMEPTGLVATVSTSYTWFAPNHMAGFDVNYSRAPQILALVESGK